jgi:hypothetical protein
MASVFLGVELSQEDLVSAVQSYLDEVASDPGVPEYD